jgi:phosphocarrier protein
MRAEEVTIVNQLGLHMRAAAKFAKLATRFRSQIVLGREGMLVDGKSIVGLLTLAASQGTRLMLHVDGDDEDAALTALKDLINGKFEEIQ